MNQELKAVWEVYKPFRKPLYVSFAGLALAQIIITAHPYVYGWALDAMVNKEGVLSLLNACLLLFALLIGQAAVSRFRENYELKHIDFDLKRSMRAKTSVKSLSLSVGQHHSEHSGIKQRIVNEGESAVVNLFRLSAYDIFPMACETAFCIIGCFIIDWQFGLLTGVATAAVYQFSKRLADKYRTPISNQVKSDDRTSKLAREIIGNVELIKLNSKEEFVVKEQDRLIREVNTGWKAIWIPLNDWLWIGAIIPRTMKVLIMFFAGLRAYQGDMSYGSALIIWRLSDTCLGKVGTINYFQRQWMELIPRISRYVQFLKIQPDIVVMEGALKVPRFHGEIEFQNVSFRYPHKSLMPPEGGDKEEGSEAERDFSVKDINLVLDPGRRYAIVGRSGQGKSTLKHLLLRSYDPTVGVIRIDGNPLTHLDLKLYHARIGVVDQDVPLLDRSLRENITWMLEEGRNVSDEEVWRVCKMACIDGFAHRLEKGLDTLIGERGVKLSGGERQRVAIARALIKDPDILVFDEATSSLDAVNEDDIVDAISKASAGKTTIMIAHRFSTILSADEIIVMDEGKVVGRGVHRNLFTNCPAYRRLVERQIRRVERMVLVG